jgi:hypothetical protein
MHRCFAPFQDALTGAGLLVLRLCDGLFLVAHSSILSGFTLSLHGMTQLAAVGLGVLTVLGFATRLAAGIGVLVGLGAATAADARILIAAIGVSLVLLGPGVWSIDARLTGRRRLDLNSL